MKHAESQCIQTEEPLQDYLRVITSVRLAIQQRQEKKKAYIDAVTDVEVKQSAHNKILGSPGKEEIAAQKQQQVLKSQTSADAAKIEYERVTTRLLNEYEDFKYQKAVDIRNILQKFIELQVLSI